LNAEQKTLEKSEDVIEEEMFVVNLKQWIQDVSPKVV